jgi:vacuolar iron transporter family protein
MGARVTANKELWLNEMMMEELGLTEKRLDDPLKVGLLIGVSSFVGAFLPILPYFFFELRWALTTSVALAAVALLATGTGKTLLTKKAWWSSGLEMVGIGLLVTVAGYGIGHFPSALRD